MAVSKGTRTASGDQDLPMNTPMEKSSFPVTKFYCYKCGAGHKIEGSAYYRPYCAQCHIKMTKVD